MQRRSCLRGIAGTIVAVASTGCLFGAFSTHTLRLEPVDDPVIFVAIPSTEFTPEQRAVVDGAADEGAYTTYGHRPFQDGEYLEVQGEYLEVQGEYYRATVERQDTERIDRMVLVAEAHDDLDDATPVADLPTSAREPAVHAARLAISRQREEGGTDQPAGYIFRAENDSMWLPEPDPEAIEYSGRTFRLRVDAREEEEDQYRTTIDRIASSRVAVEGLLEEEHVADLDAIELSPTHRGMIVAAIEDRYTERGRISDEFGELLRLIRRAAPRDDSLIKYGDEYYQWHHSPSD